MENPNRYTYLLFFLFLVIYVQILNLLLCLAYAITDSIFSSNILSFEVGT